MWVVKGSKMQDEGGQPRQYRFGSFEIDLAEGELRRQGSRIKLNEKPFRLLCVLLERAGRLVTRDDLRQRLWSADTYVDFDANLNTALSTLRHTLGDSSESPLFIETIPRQGYRFIAPVTAVQDESEAEPSSAVLEPLPEPEAETQVSSGRRIEYRKTFVAVAVFLVVSFVIAWIAHVRWVRPRQTIGKLTILVTPFENLSGDPSQDYLSDGLTDEMITRLGQISPSRLSVWARSTAMQYKHTAKSVDQIARECRADYILEGSVRRQDDRIRITAQLFKVGEQGSLWTQAYDRDAKDLLIIQQDVADRIAHSLSLEVLPEPSKSIAVSTHPELNAYRGNSQPSVETAAHNGIHIYNKFVNNLPNLGLIYPKPQPYLI